MRNIAVIFIIIALIVVSGAGAVVYWINRPHLPGEISRSLDKIMADAMKEYKSPGMLTGVWLPGKGSYVRSIGVADLKTKRRIKDTDIFRIGSLTKAFTATVVLQLVDERKLRLDDKLAKFFPKIANSKSITVRQLLNMTSGLYAYTSVPWLERRFEKNRLSAFSPEELVKIGLSHKPNFPPGRGFDYSNTNYVLLGMIIEKVTGRDLESNIKSRIIDKLKLANTSFPKGVSNLSGSYIRGYMLKDGKYEDWTVQNVSWAWAAGGMVSNLYDLKIFIKAISDGTLLSKKLQKARLNSWIDMKSKNMPSLKYGLGVFTADGFVGHNGGLPGYIDMAMYDPKTGAIVVFMLNLQPEDGGSTLKIFDRVAKVI